RRWPPKALEEGKVKKGDTPIKVYQGVEPTYKNIHVFGSVAYVAVSTEEGTGVKKVLSRPRVYKGIFVGYTKTEKQFRIWDLQSQTIKVVREATFFDNYFPAR